VNKDKEEIKKTKFDEKELNELNVLLSIN